MVYEGSVPMDIVVEIPNFVHSDTLQNCQSHDMDCFLRNSISFMYQDFDNELSGLNNSTNQNNRHPRQIAIAAAAAAGYLLRPAVHRIESALFSDDDQIRHQIDLVRFYCNKLLFIRFDYIRCVVNRFLLKYK